MFTKRNTIQRSLVLEAVNKLKCHATADEIYQEVAGNPNISKGTVYQTNQHRRGNRKIETRAGPTGSTTGADHYRKNADVDGLMWIWNTSRAWKENPGCLALSSADMTDVRGLRCQRARPAATSRPCSFRSRPIWRNAGRMP
ncbi:MAG: transcriptional repressor [Hydrogeniiclostridium mannosilyticum]